MGVELGGFDGFIEGLNKQANDLVTEHFAKELASLARDKGLDSVDSIQLEIDRSEETDEIKIDEHQVRLRANEILQGEES